MSEPLVHAAGYYPRCVSRVRSGSAIGTRRGKGDRVCTESLGGLSVAWMNILRFKVPPAAPTPRVPAAEEIAAVLEAHRYGGSIFDSAGNFLVCRCKAQFADHFPNNGHAMHRKHIAEEIAKLWGAS